MSNNTDDGCNVSGDVKYFMNIYTGEVDTYDGWWTDINNHQINYADIGEVVEVEMVNGEWIEKEY
jgi:hypothetical protein